MNTPYQHKQGLFPRIFGGIAQALGLRRKHVIIAFIVLAIMNFPLALILFGVGWLYVDKPHTWRKWHSTAENGCRKAFRHGKHQYWAHKQRQAAPETHPTAAAATAAAGPVDPEAGDPFFTDLRSRFADLEKRAGKMESYVTSEEYRLNREFRNLQS